MLIEPKDIIKSHPEKGIIIPANTYIPMISVIIDELMLKNPKKLLREVSASIMNKVMNIPNLNYEFFQVTIHHQIHISFLVFDFEGHCVYQIGMSEALECPSRIELGSMIAFPPWPSGIHTVK